MSGARESNAIRCVDCSRAMRSQFPPPRAGLRLKVTQSETGKSHIFKGRQAWFTEAVFLQGHDGITKAQMPGVHVGFYANVLRNVGIACETEMVKHDGAFSGRHAIYRIKEPLTFEVLEPDKTKPTAAATVRASNPNSTDNVEGCKDAE